MEFLRENSNHKQTILVHSDSKASNFGTKTQFFSFTIWTFFTVIKASDAILTVNFVVKNFWDAIKNYSWFILNKNIYEI